MQMQSRRDVLRSLSGAAVAGFTLGGAARAEPPPETSHIRIARIRGLCVAPQFVAEDLLRAEGITEITYVDSLPGADTSSKIASGAIDFSMNFIAPLIVAMDKGERLTLLAGVHPGCFELFVKPGINSIVELKGRSVAVQAPGSSPHLILTSMAAYVGLDPVRDINWVSDAKVKPRELFLRGDVDAFLGFMPEAQELHAKKVGRVIFNSALDRPWSQYFCCLFAGNPAFVRENPVASKRVLRAILKAADLIVAEPEMVARRLVDNKFTANYDYALQALRELPYQRWRDFDAEDAVRFYSLRLHEAGTIALSPQKIIAEGTDWRFIEELKRELKN